MIRQSLSQKMLQKLSPQQIQLMKLLQIPTSALEERIKEELESNPALEVGDNYQEVFDIDKNSEEHKSTNNSDGESSDSAEETYEYEMDDYLFQYVEDDTSNYKLMDDNYPEAKDNAIPIPVEESFLDELTRQGQLMTWNSEIDKIIAQQIIGSIDEDGYLRREVSAISDDLLFNQNLEVSVKDIERVLKIVQTFDPPGVGARDLRECLILQLKDKIRKDKHIQDENKLIGLKILENHYEEFVKKHFEKLKKVYELSDFQLREIINEIIKLNPKPATSLEVGKSYTTQYIVPDFTITNKDGELELTLNSMNAPDLKISEHFTEMLLGYKENIKAKKVDKKDKEAILFIKQKIDSARWFIDAIKQRQDTLFRTMNAIMNYQYEYFLTGDERRLKPMILKFIADETGLDISTISRVANSKFVQTEFGTKRLKDFFSESVLTTDGKEVSTLEVKNILAEIISRENKKKPYSDEVLRDLLVSKGYDIARRTVAKYRELLNIPVARLRKVI